MRSVAGTEPTTIITSLTNRDTSQMRANSQHDKPFRLLDTVGISLRVTEGLNLDGVGLLNLGGSAVADEDGLATPFDDDLERWVSDVGGDGGREG